MREYLRFMETERFTDGKRVIIIAMSIYRFFRTDTIAEPYRKGGWDRNYTHELNYHVLNWDNEKMAWLVEDDLDELEERAMAWRLAVNDSYNEEAVWKYDLTRDDEAFVVCKWE